MLVMATMRALLLYALAGAVLILNPFVACSDQFNYGLPEIEAALGGTWDAKVTKDGVTRTVKFRIEPAGAETGAKHGARHLVRPAAACAQRTLVKSAAACLDETTVPLVLIALDGAVQTMTGTFRVVGTRFEHGNAQLNLGDTIVWATVTRAGDVTRASSQAAQVELVHTR
jgi:hypothetical protein